MSNSLEELDDIELFYLLRSDKKISERAFAELYSRHSSRVYAYCRRFLGNREEAQDVFQETFVRFFQSAEQERNMTNVPAFLYKITRNLCVNSKRREKNNLKYEEYMTLQPGTRLDDDELLNLIKISMDLLAPEYKEMFILREYDGLSYTEIADITETTVATVKIRLFRAKQKIREILAPYLSEMSK